MRISLLSAAAFCAALLSVNGAAAQERQLAASTMSGWEAVGRLNLNNRAMCTGSLIAPDVVLTAAHCLFDPRTGRKVPAAKIKFDAGLAGGKARATRTVVEKVVHPDYRHNHNGPNDASVDLALLKLDAPIQGANIEPFVVDTLPEAGDPLGVISYTYSRKTTPVLQHPCDVLARKGDVLVMNCEVDFGASGAPVFAVRSGSKPRLVSVISSKAAMGNRPVSVGTIIDQALQDLLRDAG